MNPSGGSRPSRHGAQILHFMSLVESNSVLLQDQSSLVERILKFGQPQLQVDAGAEIVTVASWVQGIRIISKTFRIFEKR